MAYRLEGKDIVISGFDKGIAPSPYVGTADMRNVEVLSTPGDAGVQFANTAATKPPVYNAVAYTGSASADTLTLASTTGLYNLCAVKLASNTAGGLSNNVVYYVRNLSGNTFQLSLSVLGSVINITSDGTGTLTTYQYGNQRTGDQVNAPVSYTTSTRNDADFFDEGTYVVDASNYVWYIPNRTSGSLTSGSMYFLGNIGGGAASSSIQSGVAVWRNYVFLFRSGGIDIAQLTNLAVNGPAATWVYSWSSVTTSAIPSGRIPVIIGTNMFIYFASGSGHSVGSINQNFGTTFDPTNSATYTVNQEALLMPENDFVYSFGQNEGFLYIGGVKNFVYIWDTVSSFFLDPIQCTESLISTIVGTRQNIYFSAGNKGRWYVTNGSSATEFFKISDYVTGTYNPYYVITDANYSWGNLIFTFVAYTNSGTLLTTVGGVWAIDLETEALRMLNVASSGYAAYCSMAVSSFPSSNRPVGTGLLLGGNSTDYATYFVDVGSSNPYTSYETYIDTEIIPVGTFINPFSPSQIEWKTSTLLVANEGVKISYRTNLTDGFTLIGETTTAGVMSDNYKANFQKAQWVQFRVNTKSTATTPSYARVTEVRIRDYPN